MTHRNFAIGLLMGIALPLAASAQDATNSAMPAAPSAPERHAQSVPSTFGTSFVSYYMIPANEFMPFSSSETYTTDNFGAGPRYPTANAKDLVAAVHLPTGAVLTSLELDFDDTSATEKTFGSLYVCNYHAQACTQHPSAGGGPADCLLGGFLCSGTAATFSSGASTSATLTPDAIKIDNFNNHYIALAEPSAFDGTEKVDGMIIGYKLTVSDPPGAADFADVPTTSPQFKFVEALFKAGITSGCGGGNFCPDQAVTRGQMAVFLASALGLQYN